MKNKSQLNIGEDIMTCKKIKIFYKQQLTDIFQYQKQILNNNISSTSIINQKKFTLKGKIINFKPQCI